MVKRVFGILLILSLPFLSPGADKEKKAYELIYQDVQLLRQQFLQLSEKIKTNTNDIDFIKEQLKEILTLARRFQTEQASFKEDQKKIPAQYQILLEKLDAVNRQLTQFSQDITQIKKFTLPPELQEKNERKEAEVPPAEAQEEQPPEEADLLPTPTTYLSPQEVYNTAYSDYLKGNYELAIDGFKIYLEQFPKSPLADNSQYWIGECNFSQKKYQEAIETFNDLILKHPFGDKVPAAYLKKGISFIELGKKEEALSVFKLLISKYPLEEETKIAQQKIKELS